MYRKSIVNKALEGKAIVHIPLLIEDKPKCL